MFGGAALAAADDDYCYCYNCAGPLAATGCHRRRRAILQPRPHESSRAFTHTARTNTRTLFGALQPQSSHPLPAGCDFRGVLLRLWVGQGGSSGAVIEVGCCCLRSPLSVCAMRERVRAVGSRIGSRDWLLVMGNKKKQSWGYTRIAHRLHLVLCVRGSVMKAYAQFRGRSTLVLIFVEF